MVFGVKEDKAQNSSRGDERRERKKENISREWAYRERIEEDFKRGPIRAMVTRKVTHFYAMTHPTFMPEPYI